VLRLENLTEAFPAAMDAFLPHTQGLVLRKSNVNEGSADAAFYRQVRDSLAIPLEVLERVYASRYARHFYSDKERDDYMAYWSDPGRRRV